MLSPLHFTQSLMNNKQEKQSDPTEPTGFRLFISAQEKREALTSQMLRAQADGVGTESRSIFPQSQASFTRLPQPLEGHSDLIIFVYTS